MKVPGKSLFWLSILVCITLTDIIAQSADITFNVNLQPQLKDSIFIPGRDRLIVTGNQYPFNQPDTKLTDTSTPKDSVYTVTLKFFRRDFNKTFNYSFVMYIDGEPIRESMVRQINVRPEDQDLDALYFDAFAW